MRTGGTPWQVRRCAAWGRARAAAMPAVRASGCLWVNVPQAPLSQLALLPSPCLPACPPPRANPTPAGLQFRSATYNALGARLKALADELCGGRLVFLLEGGYDLKALGESVANTFLGE